MSATNMELRQLGASGFMVPVLGFGTGTFGCGNELFKAWGSVIIGARNEAQLRQNLGAVGWSLTPEQVAALDAASETTPAYPYWHQRGFAERNPPPVRQDS